VLGVDALLYCSSVNLILMWMCGVCLYAWCMCVCVCCFLPGFCALPFV
jgi:hypothetical protein